MVVLLLNKLLIDFKNIIPGILLISLIGFVANFISNYILIGSIAISMIIGIIYNNTLKISPFFKPGIEFGEKKILNFAIILMGAQLNFKLLEIFSWKVFLLITGLVLSSIIISLILGKIFNLSSGISLLIGVGNGICGSSAIAGVSSILKSKKEDIGLSISAINIVGALGVFLVPAIIFVCQIDSIFSKGMIVGGTIQAVGQVTAAGFIMGDEVGKLATIIKMIRILMLGPIMIVLAVMFNKNSARKGIENIFSIPFFIIGFILMSLLTNINLFSAELIEFFIMISKYALIISMAAIGLKVSVSSIFNKGAKVIFVSFITFLIQIFICIHFVT